MKPEDLWLTGGQNALPAPSAMSWLTGRSAQLECYRFPQGCCQVSDPLVGRGVDRLQAYASRISYRPRAQIVLEDPLDRRLTSLTMPTPMGLPSIWSTRKTLNRPAGRFYVKLWPCWHAAAAAAVAAPPPHAGISRGSDERTRVQQLCAALLAGCRCCRSGQVTWHTRVATSGRTTYELRASVTRRISPHLLESGAAIFYFSPSIRRVASCSMSVPGY